MKLKKQEVNDLVIILEDYLKMFKQSDKHKEVHKEYPCERCELAETFLKKLRSFL